MDLASAFFLRASLCGNGHWRDSAPRTRTGRTCSPSDGHRVDVALLTCTSLAVHVDVCQRSAPAARPPAPPGRTWTCLSFTYKTCCTRRTRNVPDSRLTLSKPRALLTGLVPPPLRLLHIGTETKRNEILTGARAERVGGAERPAMKAPVAVALIGTTQLLGLRDPSGRTAVAA